jgi:DNA primase large subunit
MELIQLATYPYLSISQNYIREQGPTLDDMLTSMAFASARAKGRERVLEALNQGEVLGHRYNTDLESISEMLSYISARMIISCIRDPYLIRRYALAEAVRANNLLQEEDTGFIMMVLQDIGIEVEQVEDGDGTFRMDFLEFLKNTSQMRAKEWKIVNQPVDSGFVILDRRHLCRVVQEVLRKRFESELPLPVSDSIKQTFKDAATEIKAVVDERKKKFEPRDFGVVAAEDFPPCITKIMADIRNGENVPHAGRFALVAFLNTIGMSEEEILRIFAIQPDFNEDKTRYQIEHITGKISGTTYTPPECTTMKSNGICPEEDNLCSQEWMTHPLKYYRSRRRRKRGSRPPARTGKKEEEKRESKD